MHIAFFTTVSELRMQGEFKIHLRDTETVYNFKKPTNSFYTKETAVVSYSKMQSKSYINYEIFLTKSVFNTKIELTDINMMMAGF